MLLKYAVIWLATVLVCFISRCAGDAPEDLIRYMPRIQPQPGYRQYSGFLQATGSNVFHYWFIESERNPTSDPLVLWLNGGPGCSSFLGLLTENGPFRVENGGENLKYNPYAWTKISNMIFLESPACVGYSYSNKPTCETDDDEVARNNHAAITSFFKKFPEYRAHNFYMTGESYAGIYLPTLTVLVQQDTDINWQATAIGNGLLDIDKVANGQIYFAYYHSMFGESLWKRLLKYCCDGNSTNCNFYEGSKRSETCWEYYVEAHDLGNPSYFNPYNIYYECLGYEKYSRHYIPGLCMGKYNAPNTNPPTSRDVTRRGQMSENMVAFAQNRIGVPAYVCGNDSAAEVYMNFPEVREAMNIPPYMPRWSMCSADVTATYKTVYMSMAAQFHTILSRKGRLLVYNGDMDVVCSALSGEWFVDSLGYPLLEKRQVWYYPDEQLKQQVAGFVKYFAKNLTFTTIRGSGHYVPTDRARASLIMYDRFLNNMPF